MFPDTLSSVTATVQIAVTGKGLVQNAVQLSIRYLLRPVLFPAALIVSWLEMLCFL